MERCVNALKEWTGKARVTTIYDSAVDEFTADGLFNKVKGKPNIAIVGFTTDGDVFGGFYSVAVPVQDGFFFDPNIFAFSLESRGRCMTPQRFDVKTERKTRAGVKFFKNDSDRWFVAFGGRDCWFALGNEKSYTCSYGLSRCFEGIRDTTLTGKGDGTRFSCTRLVALQLA